jgi:TolB-like protein
MITKKASIVVIFLFTAVALCGQGKDVYTLDNAINEAALYLKERLEVGAKIAVLNIKTTSPEIADYIFGELSKILVNDGGFTVVERKDLQLIQEEMNFQLSGEVSDESAQAIGNKLGAQIIISGSFGAFGEMYRFSVKALEVETAEVVAQENYTVRKDDTLKRLLPYIPDTVGQKIGTGALNILFGLGSYLKGDVWGGVTITAGWAAAAGLFAVEAAALDWDNPAVGVPATVGVCAAGLAVVYGFVRPFIYKRSARVAALLDNAGLAIVLALDNRGKAFGNAAVRLSYTFEF